MDRKAAVRAGIVGAVMAGIVLGCGSLWPAIIIHAAIDINSGSLAFHALRRSQGGSPEPDVAAAA
jgi:membrane protease YdiL (CAAX protease family)